MFGLSLLALGVGFVGGVVAAVALPWLFSLGGQLLAWIRGNLSQ